MATATTRRKASLSSAERLNVVVVVYVVVKLILSSEAAKDINIASYYSLKSIAEALLYWRPHNHIHPAVFAPALPGRIVEKWIELAKILDGNHFTPQAFIQQQA